MYIVSSARHPILPKDPHPVTLSKMLCMLHTLSLLNNQVILLDAFLTLKCVKHFLKLMHPSILPTFQSTLSKMICLLQTLSSWTFISLHYPRCCTNNDEIELRAISSDHIWHYLGILVDWLKRVKNQHFLSAST